ncbi:MAG: DUF6429 family protein [Candidatus Methanomethylophilaceae archaeon]|nr:DUF6429 family protein [Candidatus Methanomethylophilaceae archaeon]
MGRINDSTYDDLVLMMLYAKSWEEKYSQGYRSSWKGFDFDSLNRLEAKELITGNHRNKSTALTPEGVEKAKELLRRYGFE